MKSHRYKEKVRLSRKALMSIFMEEAKRIADDDKDAKAAADEAISKFSRNYPDMVESG
ncbi:MAG: hypothetical protein OEY50_10885 [Nitrospinota bacterium]|nr:hypothetical protein [Nitrospinota bacterium]MDH5679058.1 hypothetical protein [Nitrospinota bacterium]MDH5757853.1 hypothetical protein [Nitrospinota bacterium]